MDIDQIRELVRLMVDNDLDELDITEGESKVRLRRNASAEVVAAPAGAAPAAAPASAPVEAPPAEEQLIEIKSPMVGTYYAASSPEAGPFVTAGSSVSEDTVVCIIEAMKVMNELKAECSGEVVEVCVRNTEPVEYGQVLFRVKPL